MKNFSPIQSKCLTRFLIENSISSSKTGTSISTDNTAFGIDQNTQCLNINNISNLKSLKTGSLILNVSLINTNLNNLLYDSISCNIYVTKKCEQEFYAVASDNVLIDNSNYITRFISKQLIISQINFYSLVYFPAYLRICLKRKFSHLYTKLTIDKVYLLVMI